DAALPKAGGTMTGEIIIDSGALMRFKGVGTDPDWAFRRDDANDGFVIAPRKADNSDWDWAKQVEFRPDNFIVNGNTNLLKKTGGIVTGEVKLEGWTAQLHLDEWAQSVRVDQPTADA
ncbi:BppU family phage baseplate upper protein, partial [Bacillus cereus group sp. Bce015]